MTNSARYVPAYGSIRSLVGYAFFYLGLRAVGPRIVSVLAGHGIPSRFATLVLRGVLVLMLGVTLVDATRRQWHTVTSRHRTDRRVNGPSGTRAPSLTVFAAVVVGTVISGAIVANYWPRFLGALDTMIVAVGFGSAATISSRVVFWVAFVALAISTFGWCLDRTLIGGTRRLLARK